MRNALIVCTSRIGRVFFRQRDLPPAPRAVVVLKPCCLGDVVLATPAIAALKRRYPRAALDVAVGQWSRAVLTGNPHIRQLVDCGRVGRGRYTPADVWRLAARLRQHRYDLAVTLDRSPLVGLVPWLAGIPHRLGLDSAGRGFAHTVRVPVPPQPRHEALLYLDCVSATGIETVDDAAPRFWSACFPSPGDAANLPPLPGGSLVILHPAGGVNPGMKLLDKRWPCDRFAALGHRLAQTGRQVIITGTGDDLPLAQKIASGIAPSPIILAGALTLGQFGALCRQADLFVGGDTGAMHLAVAAGCKTVAIFGPTNPRRYGPFAPPGQATAVWRTVPLPPGGVGQGQAPPFDWHNGASVDEVWAACRRLLGESE
ncbi:MAG: glycosyltransferase family 9 protein [Anaerolineae bacterium]